MKKISTLFLFLLLPTLLLAFSGAGTGTSEDPFQVTTVDELQEVSYISGTTVHYRIMNDIDASATHSWNPNGDGTYAGFRPIHLTNGEVRGGGHVISNLYVNLPDSNYVGLFSHAGVGAFIDSLGLTNVSVTGKGYVGGLIGGKQINDRNIFTELALYDCYVSGVVTGDFFVGGVIGYLYESKMRRCFSSATVIGRSTVGGLVGVSMGSDVHNSYSTGHIYGKSFVGGAIGNNSTINYTNGKDHGRGYFVYSTSNVQGYSSLGGVTGDSADLLYSCFWDNETSGIASGISQATGKTSSELMNFSTFTVIDTPAGVTRVWDMAQVPTQESTVWKIGEGYPYLSHMYSDDITLTYSHGDNGTLTGLTSQTTPIGTNGKTVTAIPDDEYSFLEWSDKRRDNPRTDINTVLDVNVTARFTPTCTLSYTIENGSGSLNGETIQYIATTQTGSVVTAIPEPGYLFAGWSDGRIDNPRIDSTVSSNVIVTAKFLAFDGGDGTSGNPYGISTIEHLQGMRDYPEAHFILNNNIDASVTHSWIIDNKSGPTGFQPIGVPVPSYIPTPHITRRLLQPFTGSFNGNGKSISNLYINYPESSYVALWGYASNAHIENITIENASVNGRSYVGGFIGLSDSNTTIIGNSFSGTISGAYEFTGGIIGCSRGSIVSKCRVSADLNGTKHVGGIIGYSNKDTITLSMTSGTAIGNYQSGKFSTGSYIGGISGQMYNTLIENSVSHMNMSGQNYVGGVLGYFSSGTIKNSLSTGILTPQDSSGSIRNFSGIAGMKFSSADIQNCFWDSTTIVTTTENHEGGKSTEEMKKEATFTGFDFNSVWTINEDISYPMLQWTTVNLRYTAIGNGSISGMTDQTIPYAGEGTAVTAIADPGSRFMWWSDSNSNETRTDSMVLNDTIFHALFGIISVNQRAEVTIDSLPFPSSVDTVISQGEDTLVSTINFQELVTTTKTFTDSIAVNGIDSLIFASDSTESMKKDTLPIDTLIDTLNYIPIYSEIRDSSNRITLDTITTVDSVFSPQSDTLVFTVDTLISTDSLFLSIDSLRDNAVFKTEYDTIVTIEITELSKEVDTLYYIPTQSIVIDSTIDSVIVDTTITADSVIQPNLDTVVTTMYTENSIETMIVTTTYFSDTLLDSINADTTISENALVVNTFQDTLFYVPTKTVVRDSVANTEVIDTSIDIDTAIAPNRDTVVTTVLTENSIETTVFTTRFFTDTLLDSMRVDSSIAEFSKIVDTTVDTLFYDEPVSLVESKIKSRIVHFSQNPISQNDSEVMIYLPKEYGHYTVRIFDPVGNRVNELSGDLSEENIAWNVTSKYGVPLSSGSYLVVLTVRLENGTQYLTKSVLGIQR